MKEITFEKFSFMNGCYLQILSTPQLQSIFIEYYEKTNGVKLSNSNIYSVCNGKYSTYKNMHFSYVSKEFFNEMKLKHHEKVVGDFFKSAKDNKEVSA